MPTWTFDLVYNDNGESISGGFSRITNSEILGFEQTGMNLYTPIYHSSDSDTPFLKNLPVPLTIQNLKRETTLNLIMQSAPDGYNILTDDITVVLESDGQTVYYNTTITNKIDLTVSSDYYAVLTIEIVSGATLPS